MGSKADHRQSGPVPAQSTSAAAFEAYLRAGSGRPGLWRVLVTLLLIIIVEILMLNAILFGAALVGAEALLALESPRGQMIATLAVLATAPAALALALGLLHGRPFASVLGVAGRLQRAPLLIGGGAAIILAAVGLTAASALGLVRVTMIEGYEPPWALLIAAALLIPAQAAGEELVFRGYLLQEIGRRLPFAIAWAGLPSILFALLHYGGGDNEFEAAAYVASTFLFGLFAAALVWRTAGLSAAIGLHVVNNWVAICLFEPPQGVAGLGPLSVRFAEGGVLPSLAIDALLLGLALIALWRILPAPETRPQTAPTRTIDTIA